MRTQYGKEKDSDVYDCSRQKGINLPGFTGFYGARACLKIAFRQMWGVHLMGMNFQTRSSTALH